MTQGRAPGSPLPLLSLVLSWSLFALQVQKLIVLDPQKRLTVQQALEHPWVTGKAAKFAHMDSTQKKLQEFNARRKLKVRRESGLGREECFIHGSQAVRA